MVNFRHNRYTQKVCVVDLMVRHSFSIVEYLVSRGTVECHWVFHSLVIALAQNSTDSYLFLMRPFVGRTRVGEVRATQYRLLAELAF